MKITKFEHTCLTIEQGSRVLVIDPGMFSESFNPTDNIDVVIITHEHSDHFDPNKIFAIRKVNPDVKIFTTNKVASELTNATEIKPGEKVTVNNFELEFFGHDHAAIIDNIVPCDNFGVIINNIFSYAGDSFTLPPVKPTIMALPASAPWLKVDEAIKYLTAVQPTRVFPTHDALLSKVGQDITYNWLRKFADELGIEFIDIQIGQSIEV